MPVDYDAARALIEAAFLTAARSLLEGRQPPAVPVDFQRSCDLLFQSKTQAYRECLLGCEVARIQDRTINIRHPYVGHGPSSFNGRSLDERVVNPFLHSQRIPCSKRPYLSTFRRSVRFTPATKAGVRDKQGYSGLLRCLAILEDTDSPTELMDCLSYTMFKFAELREASTVPLTRVHRFSLAQYSSLIDDLLATPSGGRFPLFLVVATFTAIQEGFDLSQWEIAWQGINVADSPSGAVGDVTIRCGGRTLLAAEITERVVNKARVVSTFYTKIAPAGIEDYLFVVNPPGPDAEAYRQAHQYFTQGHEVNFVEIKNWMTMIPATTGKRGRSEFNRTMITLLDEPNVPKSLKVAWNEAVSNLIASAD